MDWSAAHVAFVVAAYAVSFAGLILLTTVVLIRDRKLKRQIAALERNRGYKHGRG